MRKKIIIGNWKMNLTYDDAKQLVMGINRFVVTHNQKSDIVVCPSYPFLHMVEEIFHHNQVEVGAQNVSEHENGAYTGEVSAEMLASMEIDYLILGHSERRKYYHDTDELIAQKMQHALSHKITPILCVGETLEERNKGKEKEVVKKQLQHFLQLPFEQLDVCIVAYEPVWAIGTGETATPDEAQEMHAYIRSLIEEAKGEESAQKVRIVYGGSVNPANAKNILSQEDVDGALVGGASLDLDQFIQIINASDSTF